MSWLTIWPHIPWITDSCCIWMEALYLGSQPLHAQSIQLSMWPLWPGQDRAEGVYSSPSRDQECGRGGWWIQVHHAFRNVEYCSSVSHTPADCLRDFGSLPSLWDNCVRDCAPTEIDGLPQYSSLWPSWTQSALTLSYPFAHTWRRWSLVHFLVRGERFRKNRI